MNITRGSMNDSNAAATRKCMTPAEIKEGIDRLQVDHAQTLKELEDVITQGERDWMNVYDVAVKQPVIAMVNEHIQEFETIGNDTLRIAQECIQLQNKLSLLFGEINAAMRALPQPDSSFASTSTNSNSSSMMPPPSTASSLTRSTASSSSKRSAKGSDSDSDDLI